MLGFKNEQKRAGYTSFLGGGTGAPSSLVLSTLPGNNFLTERHLSSVCCLRSCNARCQGLSLGLPAWKTASPLLPSPHSLRMCPCICKAEHDKLGGGEGCVIGISCISVSRTNTNLENALTEQEQHLNQQWLV